MSVTLPGFRNWTALEPDARALTVAEGARGRLADPLFMLAQQWRAGEFRHVEGGLPIAVSLEVDEAAPVAIRDGSGTREALDGTERAEEPLAEPPVRSGEGRDPRAAADLASQVAALVAGALDAADAGEREEIGAAFEELIARFAPGDDEHARLVRLRVAAGDRSAFDGIALRRTMDDRDDELRAGPLWRLLRDWAVADGAEIEEIEDVAEPASRPRLERSPERHGLVSDRAAGRIRRLLNPKRIRRREFASRHDLEDRAGKLVRPMLEREREREREEIPRAPEPPSSEADAFDPVALGHRAQLTMANADGSEFQVALAPDDRDARLAWHRLGAPESSEEPSSGDDARTLVPARLSFAGKPPERLWSLDERGADWVGASAGPADLVRVVAGQAMLSQSADWFVVPVTAGRNRRVRVQEVTLRDGFGRGEARPRPATNDPALRLWVAVGEEGADRFNAFAERVPLLGDPVETTVLAPDDAANLLWLIERVLPDAMGRGVARDASVPPPATATTPTYELQRPPPPHWHPMSLTGGGRFEMRPLLIPGRGRAAPAGLFGTTVRDLDRGRVPMRGLTLTRRWAMGRDLSGRAVMWIARDISAARETGGSGLAHDRLTLPSDN